ncbi:uncharacterized protein LOC34621491 [Cyclospora cayetanensis]|uniref:Uncharacterized protein LOC34621491 n=1 Tax=Cyclospora cayetanensis TaxID=88456 RepID=A0A6P5WCI7_9EIME|nr:uncharacterized protein LOC34621491 [Cyclospora cayetanensis]
MKPPLYATLGACAPGVPVTAAFTAAADICTRMGGLATATLRNRSCPIGRSLFKRYLLRNSRDSSECHPSSSSRRLCACGSEDAESRECGFRGKGVNWSEVEFRSSRSGKPGGQSSNKSSSKVQLRLDIKKQTWLCRLLQERLQQQQKHAVSAAGVLLLRCEDTPSQQQNKERVKQQLLLLLQQLAQQQEQQHIPVEQRKTLQEKRQWRQKLFDQKRIAAYRRQWP